MTICASVPTSRPFAAEYRVCQWRCWAVCVCGCLPDRRGTRTPVRARNPGVETGAANRTSSGNGHPTRLRIEAPDLPRQPRRLRTQVPLVNRSVMAHEEGLYA